MSLQLYDPILVLACAGLAPAAALGWRTSVGCRRAVGPIVQEAGRQRPWSVAFLTGPLLLLAGVALVGLPTLFESLPLQSALVIGLFACTVRPTPHLERLGEGGVQRGLVARRFSELEEWRLVGDHLRFRLGERWFAIGLPNEAHAPTRERLVAAAADRESRYR